MLLKHRFGAYVRIVMDCIKCLDKNNARVMLYVKILRKTLEVHFAEGVIRKKRCALCPKNS